MSLARRLPTWVLVVGLALLLVGIAVLSTFSGFIAIGFSDLARLVALGSEGLRPESPRFDPEAFQLWQVLVNIRLPRVVAAVLAGAALATSGAVMQGILRNPLAGPDILGVSAGASLGAIVAIASGAGSLVIGIPLGAIVGAFGIATVVYGLATRRRGTGLLEVVLAGLAVASLTNGIISTILLFAKRYEIDLFLLWTLGGLDGRIWDQLWVPLPTIAVGLTLVLMLTRRLNLLALGEEQAHAAGLGVEGTKRLLMVTSVVLTAMAISVAGPIGFIGLLAPHLVRLIVGADHRRLIPIAALGGACLLVVADWLGRILIPPYEIKAGIITALVGGPLFLYLILRQRVRS